MRQTIRSILQHQENINLIGAVAIVCQEWSYLQKPETDFPHQSHRAFSKLGNSRQKFLRQIRFVNGYKRSKCQMLDDYKQEQHRRRQGNNNKRPEKATV